MDYKADVYLAGYTGLSSSSVADFLGKSFSDKEHAVATSLIAAYEHYIAKVCRRNFLYDLGSDDAGNLNRYIELLDGGLYEYFLHNFPIAEVLRIELDDKMLYDSTDLSNNSYIKGQDFVIENGSLCFTNQQFSNRLTQRNTVKIYYTIEQFWGDDVVQAITQWVADTMSSREYAGKQVASFSFSGYSVNFVPRKGSIPDYVEEVINGYMKVLL